MKKELPIHPRRFQNSLSPWALSHSETPPRTPKAFPDCTPPKAFPELFQIPLFRCFFQRDSVQLPFRMFAFFVYLLGCVKHIQTHSMWGQTQRYQLSNLNDFSININEWIIVMRIWLPILLTASSLLPIWGSLFWTHVNLAPMRESTWFASCGPSRTSPGSAGSEE